MLFVRTTIFIIDNQQWPTPLSSIFAVNVSVSGLKGVNPTRCCFLLPTQSTPLQSNSIQQAKEALLQDKLNKSEAAHREAIEVDTLGTRQKSKKKKKMNHNANSLYEQQTTCCSYRFPIPNNISLCNC